MYTFYRKNTTKSWVIPLIHTALRAPCIINHTKIIRRAPRAPKSPGERPYAKQCWHFTDSKQTFIHVAHSNARYSKSRFHPHYTRIRLRSHSFHHTDSLSRFPLHWRWRFRTNSIFRSTLQTKTQLDQHFQGIYLLSTETPTSFGATTGSSHASRKCSSYRFGKLPWFSQNFLGIFTRRPKIWTPARPNDITRMKTGENCPLASSQLGAFRERFPEKPLGGEWMVWWVPAKLFENREEPFCGPRGRTELLAINECYFSELWAIRVWLGTCRIIGFEIETAINHANDNL